MLYYQKLSSFDSGTKSAISRKVCMYDCMASKNIKNTRSLGNMTMIVESCLK